MKLNLSNLVKHYSSYALWAITAIEAIKVQMPEAYAQLPGSLVMWIGVAGLIVKTVPQPPKK